jgi:hypothetical protein
MVDPEYDFLNDQPSPKRRDRWTHDRFAHEFFDEPIFDGMLVSKASLRPTAERRILQAGGVRPFTRLDPGIPTMADCGAFTYLLEEKPAYSVQQVLDYYHDFGFDYGVSLDHLAFVTVEMLERVLKQGKVKTKWWDGKTTEQIHTERFELTLQNAQEFLNLHTRQKPKFQPIGIAQGGTPELYYAAVERLIHMGYQHIALGGLVKSSDQDIIAILEKIHPLIQNGTFCALVSPVLTAPRRCVAPFWGAARTTTGPPMERNTQPSACQKQRPSATNEGWIRSKKCCKGTVNFRPNR